MTAKEKAKELVCKMYGCEINTYLNDIYILNSEGYFLAVDSAIIAVEEIIEQNNIWIKQIGKGTNNYLEQVKTEIENL